MAFFYLGPSNVLAAGTERSERQGERSFLLAFARLAGGVFLCYLGDRNRSRDDHDWRSSILHRIDHDDSNIR